MTTSRRRLRPLCAAVALVLVVAACGGEDGSDTSDAPPTTAPSEDTTTTEDDTDGTAADDLDTDDTADDDTDDAGVDDHDVGADDDAAAEALAEAIVLTEDDFTAEWTAEPDEEDPTDLKDCFQDVDLGSELLAESTSPNFSQESADAFIGVGSTGLVVTNAKVAADLVVEAGTDAWAGCALDLLSESFGAALLDADLNPAGDGGVGDSSAVLNGYFSVEDDEGNVLDGETSLWLIATGEAVTGISVVDFGDTEFATAVDQVTAIVADRQAEAVG